MPNIRDIARKAQTSVSTVSRVLNKSGYVSASVRTRVNEAIEELGYRPNASARQMGGARSKMVGILLPGLDIPFFGLLAHTLEQQLFDHGYHSLICNTAENSENERKYVNMLLSQKIDGAIVASAHSDSVAITSLRDAGIPIVAIDRPILGQDIPVVCVDNVAGGRQMAEHLAELGHRCIGVIGAPMHSQPVIGRLSGIKAAMADLGLPEPVTSLGVTHSLEACYSLGQRLLSKAPNISAICGLTDIAAVGAMHAAGDIGKHVPNDISIIGFDNLPESEFVRPKLTTISQPVGDLGRSAVELLLNLIGAHPNLEYEPAPLPLKLIVRDSTSRMITS